MFPCWSCAGPHKLTCSQTGVQPQTPDAPVYPRSAPSPRCLRAPWSGPDPAPPLPTLKHLASSSLLPAVEGGEAITFRYRHCKESAKCGNRGGTCVKADECDDQGAKRRGCGKGCVCCNEDSKPVTCKESAKCDNRGGNCVKADECDEQGAKRRGCDPCCSGVPSLDLGSKPQVPVCSLVRAGPCTPPPLDLEPLPCREAHESSGKHPVDKN
ncbi:hypothetical protein C7M84_006862 [Penaeus vannamei]|uniref:Uncharacterized protein n=1 Tax=Penaeus vannamei TaxID=6689 RepID=A0A3R7M839_PENVA|nr:hypothetical protein C7M84_006862 [Penaeus vannamei]